ncbi:Ig-like domain repeat protein, partial [Elusimicrobiota bacterium]
TGSVTDLHSQVDQVWVEISSGTQGGGTQRWWDGDEWVSASTKVLATVTGGNWAYMDAPYWADNERFYVYATGVDVVGNTETKGIGEEDLSFFYDITDPTSRVTEVQGGAPFQDNGYHNDITLLKGTADDGGAGTIYNIKLSLRDVFVGNRCWDGDSWELCAAVGEIWFDVTTPGDPTWTYTVPGIWAGRLSHDFELQSMAIDESNNSEEGGAPSTIATFTLDQEEPTAAISNPDDGGYINSSYTIDGSSADATTGEVHWVDFVLEDQDSSSYRYWNGTDWGSGFAWARSTPTAGGGWEVTGIDFESPEDKDGHEIVFYVKAVDRALPTRNEQTSFGVGTSSITFTYDTALPDAGITDPEHMVNQSGLAQIVGTTSSDGEWVDLWITNLDPPGDLSNEDDWWDGTAWTGGTPASTGTDVTGGGWTYDIAADEWADGGQYKIVARARDVAGNIGLSVNASTAAFYYDVSYPTSTIKIPAVAFSTVSVLPQISGTSADLTPGGVTNVKFWFYRPQADTYWSGAYKADGMADWTGSAVKGDAQIVNMPIGDTSEDWKYVVPYPSATFSSITSENKYRIYVEAYDAAGNPSVVSTRAFVWDSVAPSCEIHTPTEGTIYTGLQIASGTVSDYADVSSLDQVQVVIWDQTDDTYWNGVNLWVNSVSSITADFDVAAGSWSIQWDSNKLPPSDKWNQEHTYLIRAFGKDAPGNVEDPPWSGGVDNAVEFDYDGKVPTSNVTDPVSGSAKKAGYNMVVGVAEDGIGVDSVLVQVIRYSVGLDPQTTHYYQGGGWVAGDGTQWSDVDTCCADWIFNISNWTDGYKYVVFSSATDQAGNRQDVTSGGNSFVYDLFRPTVTIANPVNGGELGAVSVDGTYLDEFSGSALSFVRVSIKRDEDGLYWRGTATGWLGSSEFWLTAATNEVEVSTNNGRRVNWGFADMPPWEDQKYYTVRAYGKDMANNEITGGDIDLSNFKYDASAPQSGITTPAPTPQRQDENAVQIVQGWAKAGVEVVTAINIAIKHVTSSNYWYTGDGSGDPEVDWSGTETWLPVTWFEQRGDGYYYWYYNNLPSDANVDWDEDDQYEIYSRAQTSSRIETPGYITIRMDSSYRQSVVDSPALGYVGGGVSNISGKAWDKDYVGAITASIQRDADGKYWDEGTTSWQSGAEVWNTAVNDGSGSCNYSCDEWHFDSSNVDWESGKHTIRSRAGYDDGWGMAWEEAHGGNTIFIDVTPPVSYVTEPDNAATFSPTTLALISGTAEDDVSGMASVKVMIDKLDGGASYYWTGNSGAAGTWDTAKTWVTGNWKASYWDFDATQVNWAASPDGTEHNFRVRGTDAATNEQADGDEDLGPTATLDATGPTSLVGTPTDGLLTNSLDTITGTAEDALSTVAQAQVCIKEVQSGFYWNGTDLFNQSEANCWHDKTGGVPTNWNYQKGFPWVSDYDYEIRARASDSLNTVGDPTAVVTITFDTDEPTSFIQKPSVSQTRVNSLPVISGTADDESIKQKVAKVEVNLVEDLGNAPFNAWDCATSDWVAKADQATQEAAWCELTGSSVTFHETSATWKMNVLSSDWADALEYRLRTRAEDEAGNVDVIFSTRTFTWDVSAAEAFVSTPPASGVFNSASMPTITGTATDDGGVGSVKMWIKKVDGGDYYWTGNSGQVGVWATGMDSHTVNTSWKGTYWEFKADKVSWDDAQEYNFRAFGVDSTGNQQGTGDADPGNDATADLAGPESHVQEPAEVNDLIVGGLAVISGTTADPGGLSQESDAELNIKEPATGKYWNGTDQFISVAEAGSWLTAGGVPTNWTYDSTDVTWTNDRVYEIKVKGTDSLINVGVATGPVTFVYDDNDPTSLIETPTAVQTRVNSMPIMSGTANDVTAQTMGISRIAKVEANFVVNRDISPYDAWDCASGDWQAQADADGQDAKWCELTSSSVTFYESSATWKMEVPVGKWGNDNSYRLRLRSEDAAGNLDLVFSTRTFLYDTDPPLSNVSDPANDSATSDGSLNTISGGVSPNTTFVRFQIYYVVGGSTLRWSGSAWAPPAGAGLDDSANWLNATDAGAGAWYYTDGAAPTLAGLWSEAVYYIRTWSRDQAANDESTLAGALVKSTFTFDQTPPSAPDRLRILDPAGTVVTDLPTIRGTASDLLAGIDEVQFRLRDLEGSKTTYFWTQNNNWEYREMDDPLVWLTPDSYAPAVPITTTTWSWGVLPGLVSNNLYDVTARAKDRAGNWSVTYTTQTFKLDQDAPDSMIKSPSPAVVKLNFGYPGGATLATITGTAKDDLSNMKEVKIQIKETGVESYWDGSGWIGVSSYNIVANGGGAQQVTWDYDIPIADLTSGTKYDVMVEAFDEPSNDDDLDGDNQRLNLLVDFTNPISTVTLPLPAQVVGKGFGEVGEEIAGTANDPLGAGGFASGLQRVEMRIKRFTAQEEIWDGSAWNADAEGSFNYPTVAIGTPLDPPPGYGWEYTFASNPWTDNLRYEITSRAVDSSRDLTEAVGTGNSEWAMPKADTVWSHSFYYDESKPRSDFTNVEEGKHYNSSLTSIQGTADDDLNDYSARNIQAVKVHLYLVDLNKTYNCSDWTTTLGDTDYDGDLLDDSYWCAADFVGFSSGTWSYSVPDWQHNYNYRVVVKAVDAGDNYESDLSTVNFVYDEYRSDPERPNAGVTSPTQDYYATSKLASIDGTAQDNNPNGVLIQTKLKVLRLPAVSLLEDTTYYWDGTNWVGGDPYSEIFKWPFYNTDYDSWDETFSWSMPQGSVFWIPDRRYEVAPRSYDKAGNIEMTYSTQTFVYDLSRPTATITFPQDAGYISAAGNIAGTATDYGAGEIDIVQVRVQRDSDEHFMDLSIGPTGDWVTHASSDVWNDVSPTGDWPWDWMLSTAPWISGVNYTAEVRPIDKAGYFGVEYSTVTFGADFQKPVSKMLHPNHNEEPENLPIISGTAQDVGPSDINKVYVAYRREIVPEKWWNRSTQEWTGNEPGAPGIPSDVSPYWVQASTDTNDPVNWSVTDLSTPTFVADVGYTLLVQSVDKAGNLEDDPGSTAAGTNRVNFTYRSPSPESGITRPAAANTHFLPSGASISGTANDVATDIEVQVLDVTDPAAKLSWDATANEWKAYPAYADYQDGAFTYPNWTFDVGASSFTSLHKYEIRSRAIAPAETPQGPIVFYIDGDDPVGGVLMPDAAYKNNLPALSGTAVDASVDGPVPAPQSPPLTGATKSVYFRLARGTDFWDQVAGDWDTGSPTGDCWGAPDDTCITPGEAGGIFSVVHA